MTTLVEVKFFFSQHYRFEVNAQFYVLPSSDEFEN